MDRSLDQITRICLFILAVVFSIRQLTEPDIWWQIAAGNWMLEHGRVLDRDVFSSITNEASWHNYKWGSELLYACFSGIIPLDAFTIIQAFFSCLLLGIMITRMKLVQQQEGTWLINLLALVFLCSAAYRFNARPEAFSHLFTALFLYLIERYRKFPSKWIYLIIPLQMLWANLHDAYSIGLIVLLIWAVVEWIDRKEPNRHSKMALKIFGGALLATCINPWGYELLVSPYNIFRQVQETKFTTEFLNFRDYRFWSFETYVSVCMLIVVILGTLKIKKQGKSTSGKMPLLRNWWKQQDHFSLALLFAFTILASGAYRNIIFFSIVATPMVLPVIGRLLQERLRKVQFYLRIGLILFVGGIYYLVVNDQYFNPLYTRSNYGLRIPINRNPIATGIYLSSLPDHVVTHTFADYRTSSFLLFAFADKGFRTYVDFREYEVFTPEQFEHYREMISDTALFAKEMDKGKYSHIVLLNSDNQRLHDWLYNNPRVTLIHLDEVCAVYAKGNVFPSEFKLPAFTVSRMASTITYLFNPAFREPSTDALPPEAEAAYYMMVNDLTKAGKAIAKSDPAKQPSLLGEYYLNQFTHVPDSSQERLDILDSALTSYLKAIETDRKDAASYFGLGLIYHMRQEYKKSVKYMEECVRLNPDQLRAHLFLADDYEKLAEAGNSKQYYEKEIEQLHAAERLNPDNPFIQTDLGFIYFKLKKCDKAIHYLEKVKNFEGLTQEDREKAKHYIEHCE